MKILSWAALVVSIVVMILLFKNLEHTRITDIDQGKAEKKIIEFQQKHIDSLFNLKKELVKEEQTIHNEYNQYIQNINNSPDSFQFIITNELIRQHRRLDSTENIN